MAEVAERLALLSLSLVVGEYGGDLLREILEGHHILVLLVEPVSQEPAAQKHRVLAGRPAHDADIGVVGTRAGVGAASHAEREGVVREAELRHLRLEGVDEAGQHPLAFGDSQAAGRQGHAGHAPPPQRRDLLGGLHAMHMQNIGDSPPIGFRQIGEEQALVGRDPHARPDLGEDLPQGRLQLEAVAVDDAAVFYVEPIEKFSVALLKPADVVIEAMHVGRMAGGQRLAEVFLHLRPKVFQAHRVDRVLEPGHLAIGAVAEVALHLHDRLGNREHVFRRHEAEPLGQRRKCLRGARRHTHAAAGKHVVAENFSIFVDDDEAEVVGVDVGAVVFREGEGGLELPWEIGRAVNRLHLGCLGSAGGKRLFARLRVGQPDFVVGSRPRGEVLRKLVELGLHLVADAVAVDRRRAAHDVAFHVAAGGERRHLVGVHLLHEVLEFPLHHAVVLDRLPGRETDRAVAQLIPHLHGREQLLGGQLAAGHAGTDHERDLPLALLAVGRLLAGLAVVLLVSAVVLEQLDRRLAEARSVVGQFLRDVSHQVVAGDLGQFHGRRLGGGCGRSGGSVVRHDSRGRFREGRMVKKLLSE